MAVVVSLANTTVDLDLARRHLNFDDADHVDDQELQFFVDAANEWVAANVSDTSPTYVTLGTLELIRHFWDSQRGPVNGSVDVDLSSNIPPLVRQLLEPVLLDSASKISAPVG